MKRLGNMLVAFALVLFCCTLCTAATNECYITWNASDCPDQGLVYDDCNPYNDPYGDGYNHMQFYYQIGASPQQRIVWVTIYSYEDTAKAQEAWDKLVSGSASWSYSEVYEGPSSLSGATYMVAGDKLNGASPQDKDDWVELKIYGLYRGNRFTIATQTTEGPYCNNLTTACTETSYSSILTDYKDALSDIISRIDAKCGTSPGGCSGLTPLPTGQQDFGPEASASPVLGNTPLDMNPLGLGDLVNGGKATFSLGLCKFAGPVDVYLAYIENGGIYTLNTSGIPVPLDTKMEGLQPFLEDVDEAVDLEIDGDFGGLFLDDTHLPPNELLQFYVGVTPAGVSLFTGKFYLWATSASNVKDGSISLPQSARIFTYEPVAVTASGTDPSQIKPFALGPVAIGGDIIVPHVEMNYFRTGAKLDFHLAMYSPSVDPVNVYFYARDQTFPSNVDISSLNFEEFGELLFEEVPLYDFHLPQGKAWRQNVTASRDALENPQDILGVFTLGENALYSYEVAPAFTYYMFAVSPAGVTDKYYAWITWSGYNFAAPLLETMYNLYHH